jgi:iron-sulfur cluster repair protein YtfE (RIC family)
MNAEQTRRLLLSQHELLRGQFQTCTRLAKLFRAGHSTGRELDEALEILRDGFNAHNQAESTVIRKLLSGPGARGSLLVDRMLEEHIAEHAAFWELLSGTHAEVSERIDELADELDAHMAAEERTFLAPATLGDQVIRTRTPETSID